MLFLTRETILLRMNTFPQKVSEKTQCLFPLCFSFTFINFLFQNYLLCTLSPFSLTETEIIIRNFKSIIEKINHKPITIKFWNQKQMHLKIFLPSVKRLFSTINKKQMQQFNKIKSWWHPSSEMNVLFQYNYERIQFLREILIKQKQESFDIAYPVKGMKVIDVGCGAGFLSQSLTRLGGNVLGLDPNSTSFTEAKTHKSDKQTLLNLKYQNCSIQEYLEQNPTEREAQDLVTSMDVIQHVDNPQQFIEALVASLKPNGLIMLSTISKTLYSFLTHIVVAQYITGLVPRGTHNFQKFLHPAQLKKMLQNAGVQVLAIRQLQYNWKGQFQKQTGGANYIIIGRKLPLQNEKTELLK